MRTYAEEWALCGVKDGGPETDFDARGRIGHPCLVRQAVYTNAER